MNLFFNQDFDEIKKVFKDFFRLKFFDQFVLDQKFDLMELFFRSNFFRLKFFFEMFG